MTDHCDSQALMRKARRERSKALGDAIVTLTHALYSVAKSLAHVISADAVALKRYTASHSVSMPPLHR